MGELWSNAYVKIGLTAVLLILLKVAADAIHERQVYRVHKGPRRARHSPLESETTLVPRYRLRDDLFSPAEASFYHVLLQACAGWAVVLGKVNLGDLLYAPREAGEAQWAMWNRINRKHLDYVLCDRQTLRPLVAVELDDASHRLARRAERDAFVDQAMAQAGLGLVRVPVQQAYATAELGQRLRQAVLQPQAAVAAVAPALNETTVGAPVEAEPCAATVDTLAPEAPQCPRCGGQMVLRTAQRGVRAGQPFWGCENYPRCRGVREVEG